MTLRDARDALVTNRVLIVDDDADIRLLLWHLLRASGCEVVAAEHGSAALRRFGEALAAGFRPAFDLVLSDINMPGLSGLELLAQLKRIDPAQRVMLVSAHCAEHTREIALAAGAIAVIQKPLQLAALRDAVFAAVRDPIQSP